MEYAHSFIENLRAELRPLYASLIDSVSRIRGEKDTFAAQWGAFYPEDPNEGILFVGRATNQWHTTSLDLDELFGDPHSGSTIYNCDDQMVWVYECSGENGGYNTNRSAFWRVIRGVSSAFYPSGEELKHVAWSNVCKIQRDSGKNPYGKIYDAQIEICKTIFEVELKYLSPRFVIMFTGGYGEHDLLAHFNDGVMPQPIDTKHWGPFAVDVYNIKGTFFFCTEHPQAKDEVSHIRCLVSLIKQYS